MIRSQPFFILANPRSGSSLLRIICDCNQYLSIPPECGFMEWLFEDFKNWKAEDCKNEEKLNSLLDAIVNSKKFFTWKVEREELKARMIARLPGNYQEVVEEVYLTYGAQRKTNILKWGDKNNYYIDRLEKLNAIFPEAKYIHLLRDGRDVATSYLQLLNLKTNSAFIPQLSNSIENIAAEWDANNKKIQEFLNSRKKENVCFIRFEDVLQNTEDELRQLCEFLDVPFDKQMLEYYRINEKFQLEPSETLDWKTKTLEKPDKKAIGKYLKIFNSEEINRFNQIAKDTLIKYDYNV